MADPEPFRIRIIDLVLLTVGVALLLGPWVEMERAAAPSDWNRAAAFFLNSVLTTSFVSMAILGRCSGHRRGEEWLTGAFVGLLVNQGVAIAIPMLAIFLMPIGVVLAGGLLFYVLGHLDV